MYLYILLYYNVHPYGPKETVGVCVASYDSKGEFPAFYTKKSGCRSAYDVSTPHEAAGLLEQCQNTGSGVLLAVPIPEEKIKSNYYYSYVDSILMFRYFTIYHNIQIILILYVFKEADIDMAIKNALETCEKRGITGKNITPFVLGEISRVTEGLSMETSIYTRNRKNENKFYIPIYF